MSRQRSTLIVLLVASAALLVMVLVEMGSREAPKLARPVAPPPNPAPVIEPFLQELQERTFRYFWDTANSQNGLIPDRYPTPSYASVAAVGFGLTTYPVAAERGY